jgi:hypothetical protein
VTLGSFMANSRVSGAWSIASGVACRQITAARVRIAQTVPDVVPYLEASVRGRRALRNCVGDQLWMPAATLA